MWAMKAMAVADAMVFSPILGEPAAASEPREGAFHDPSARQDFEALGSVGSLDDLVACEER